MNNIISKISDSELSVMQVLWAYEEALPMTIIRKSIEETSQWDSSTIKTLLRRLCEKGAVSVEKRDVFYYRPLVTEKQYNDYSTQVFIDKVYRGSAKTLVAALFSGNKLKKDDIEELRAMFHIESEGVEND